MKCERPRCRVDAKWRVEALHLPRGATEPEMFFVNVCDDCWDRHYTQMRGVPLRFTERFKDDEEAS